MNYKLGNKEEVISLCLKYSLATLRETSTVILCFDPHILLLLFSSFAKVQESFTNIQYNVPRKEIGK